MLELFDTSNVRRDQLSSRDWANAGQLLQMKWRIVPCLGSKAPHEHECVAEPDGILDVSLAVRNTSDQAWDLLQDDALVELILAYDILARFWLFDTTQYGLNDQRGFVGYQCNIDRNLEADRGQDVYRLVELLFACAKA